MGPNDYRLGAFYHNMGAIHEKMGAYDSAVYYGNKARAIYEPAVGHKSKAVMTAYYNLGLAYKGLGQTEKALAHLNESLLIGAQVQGSIKPTICETYRAMGYVFFEQQQYDSARYYAQKAIQVTFPDFDAASPNGNTPNTGATSS